MATQRRKSSIQKRRSSMKRKYMKNRKVKGGLFGFFGKKAGEGEVPEPEKEEKDEQTMIESIKNTASDVTKAVLPTGKPEGDVAEGEGDVAEGEEVGPEGEEVGPVEGGKKKKRKGTKKKKGSKKRKTAKKAKKSKKKRGKK